MLDGYRVVELAIWVAGPAAGGILSDWGADVIKVEAPSGDPMRTMFGAIGIQQEAVPPFDLDNRGKRSVMLDLNTEDGLAAMHKLLATADVFITNLRRIPLTRLGLDAATIRARYPRLVYASVTGYGMEGPDRDRPGYDVGAFWARSGIAAMMAPKGEMPPPPRSAMGDHTTAITAVSGILAALLKRGKTGEGTVVNVSLLRTGIYTVGWDLGIQAYFGRLQSARPRTLHQAPLLNCYAARDQRKFWLIGLEQDRHWPGLVAAMDRQDLLTDERFATAVTRGANAEAVTATLDEIFASRTYDEWTAAFDREDVWWAPIATAPDVLADPQAAAAGAWVVMHGSASDGTSPYRLAASPVGFEGWVEHPGPVPKLGEHTEEVLGSL